MVFLFSCTWHRKLKNKSPFTIFMRAPWNDNNDNTNHGGSGRNNNNNNNDKINVQWSLMLGGAKIQKHKTLWFHLSCQCQDQGDIRNCWSCDIETQAFDSQAIPVGLFLRFGAVDVYRRWFLARTNKFYFLCFQHVRLVLTLCWNPTVLIASPGNSSRSPWL